MKTHSINGVCCSHRPKINCSQRFRARVSVVCGQSLPVSKTPATAGEGEERRGGGEGGGGGRGGGEEVLITSRCAS